MYYTVKQIVDYSLLYEFDIPETDFENLNQNLLDDGYKKYIRNCDGTIEYKLFDDGSYWLVIVEKYQEG